MLVVQLCASLYFLLISNCSDATLSNFSILLVLLSSLRQVYFQGLIISDVQRKVNQVIDNFKFGPFEIFKHELAKLEEFRCFEFFEAVINVSGWLFRLKF
ncbi:hypothetical protein GLYMA_10G288700v4 [Glycine max]|uniref:Uncharacterized protein n=1 Tax=Glycine max TaxID=3847 RepID=K7LM17_SOYBN|nr:hypothetical protein GLYMA_10G288700v4 [Glycine max]